MKNTISFNSKFGLISATEMNNKITRIYFSKRRLGGKISRPLNNLKKRISLYFQNKTQKIEVKIKIDGNKLQRKVWGELKKIKKGEVKSYGEIAKKVGVSPRFVGKVCGQNQHLLVIPCHRVLRSNGSLGGFSAPGGVNLKKKLLKFEGINLK
tara:strand:- start:10705 stop:11163 length:459 start_codon:yes stop_codon:yes gene_type:complete